MDLIANALCSFFDKFSIWFCSSRNRFAADITTLGCWDDDDDDDDDNDDDDNDDDDDDDDDDACVSLSDSSSLEFFRVRRDDRQDATAEPEAE